MARKIHYVGSAPFESAAETFKALTVGMQSLVRRLPDGEIGERKNWVLGQTRVFKHHPDFEVETRTTDPRRPEFEILTFHIRPGVKSETITFEDLHYASEAIASYEIFKAMKAAGEIPASTKFQVSLPTPFCIVWFHVAKVDEQLAIEAAYKAAMFREVDKVAAAIPHDQLAIQWDVATEMIALERGTIGGPGTAFPTRIRVYEDMAGTFGSWLAELCDAVPSSIEVMVHLCYGDWGHKHSIEPKDASKMTELANAIFRHVRRRVDLLHLPVPRERDDDAFYAPLGALRLPADTELALGVVHLTGGIAAIGRRMAAANKYVGDYAIATDCGLGRRPPETIAEVLRLHREAAARF